MDGAIIIGGNKGKALGHSGQGLYYEKWMFL